MPEVHAGSAGDPRNIRTVIHDDLSIGWRNRKYPLNALKEFSSAGIFVADLDQPGTTGNQGLRDLDGITELRVRDRIQTRKRCHAISTACGRPSRRSSRSFV